MKDIKIGKAKKILYTRKVYVKKELFERQCENPECTNIFLTKGARHYCGGLCHRKVNGRKSTWPNKKKYMKEYRLKQKQLETTLPQ